MSTLLDIRKEFVKQSGRFDLVTDYEGEDYTDSGANAIIQAGQRFLDLTQEHTNERAEFKVDLAAGDYLKRLPYLRVINEVYIYDGGEDSRIKLTPQTLSEMKDRWKSDFGQIDQAQPTHYTSEVVNLAPSLNIYETRAALEAAVLAETPDFSGDFDNILADDTFENRGILLLPPADQAYTLTIDGIFFSKLTEDTDYSYWSMKFPELCVLASNFVIECYYRNTTGMKDWLYAMEKWLNGVDKDNVKEEMILAGNQMKG